MSILFKDIYINDHYSVLGKNMFNVRFKANEYTNSFYNGKKSIEEAEEVLLVKAIDGINKKVDVCISSDLTDQLTASSYSLSKYNYPYIGVYSACSSFVSGLIVASSWRNSVLRSAMVCVWL